MTAALGTLPFLATLWLIVVLGARVLEESGAKIVAALKGELPREPALSFRGHFSPPLRGALLQFNKVSPKRENLPKSAPAGLPAAA